MNWGTIEFFILEAFRGLRRSGLLAVVAIGIVTVSLWVFGSFLLIMANMGNMVSQVGSRLDVAAYAEEELTLPEASAIQIQLSRIPNVSGVTYTSKDEAWEKFQSSFGGRLEIGEVFRDNPLPNTFLLHVEEPTFIERVAKEAARNPSIQEVRFSNQLVDQLSRLTELVRFVGFILVLLFGLATFLIVVNTIRLTVIAREADIGIMRLVGATRSFIQWPFVIEGLILGTTGGLGAALLLRFGYDLLLTRVGETLPFLPLIKSGPRLGAIYLTVLLSAVLLSVVGAFISVQRTMEKEG